MRRAFGILALASVGICLMQAQSVTCSYAISSTGQVFPAAGGMVTVNVTAPDGCAWDVEGQPDGVQVVGATTGSGNGVVTIFAQPQPVNGAARSGFFVIANLKYAVEQQAFAITGLSLVGSMPHLPGEMGWSTILTFVNKGGAAVTARTNLLAADGTAMTLPVGLPQQSSLPGPLLASSLDQIMSPNASWVMDAGGTTSSTLEGSAQLFANGTANSVDGFAIFHFDPNNQEAVVPLETRTAGSYFLAFDNTNGVQTGMAVANQSAKAANISVEIFDDSGNSLGTDTLQLMPNGHTSFVLGAQTGEKYPATAGLRGMIEFDAPVGGRISALGIRYTPPGTTTTIPALANVTAGNGIMAHLASGAGWQTTFVFVNVGQGTGVATLSFHDDNGQQLPLPLTFPQGGQADTTAFGYSTPSIVPGASWYVQSGGDLTTALLTGSAQVTTSANIGAFVIFRYNPNGQEAVVPLESRNASTYLIAFDNTAGTATGVAVANASPMNISLPYTVRDDSGTTVLVTGTLPLAANGHTSFGLSDFAPASAGRRGVIEFDAPTGASISVLGIRSPPALTFTTLPALAK